MGHESRCCITSVLTLVRRLQRAFFFFAVATVFVFDYRRPRTHDDEEASGVAVVMTRPVSACVGRAGSGGF